MRKQIDLTTLPGWANLSSGNHTIKIKAKGTGYIDSELSAGVVVSKAPSTVTLEAGTYKFVDSPSNISNKNSCDFNFTSNGNNYSTIFMGSYIDGSYINYTRDNNEVTGFFQNHGWGTHTLDAGEYVSTVSNTAYKTITLSTDQQVSPEFYKWAITDGNLVKQVEPAAYTDCLTFTGETSDFTLAIGSNGAKEWDGTVEYSTDHNTWNIWNGTAISSANKKLYLRGKGNTKFCTSKGARLSLSARAGCSGNIQTLLDYENSPTVISTDKCYKRIFYNCTSLISAPSLPATTLATECYDSMFYGCTSLTTSPELPATTLADGCYISMFDSCTNLTTAPELPATTLKGYCYYTMFSGCTKLKVNDSSGNKIFMCPTTIPTGAVTNMFTNTGGTFTGTPFMGTIYYWTE